MSALGFLGGLAGAYTNIQSGIDAANAREAQQNERDFAQSQRQRVQAQQGREDSLRGDLSKIRPAGQVDANATNPVTSQITHDDTTGPDDNTPAATQLPAVQMRTKDQEYMDTAAAFRKAGDPDSVSKAMQFEDAAHKIRFDRATQQFNQVIAGSDQADLPTLAKQIGSIFETDPYNGGVKGIEQLPNGVRITLQNKDTGAVSTREFTGPNAKQQLIGAFQSYYSPETYQTMQMERYKSSLKAQEKIDEERAKGHVLRPNAMFVPGAGDTRPQVVNSYTPPAKPGKPGDTPVGQAHSLLASIAEKSDAKPTGQQRADAENFLDRIVQQAPGVPPARAARIAYRAATDPTATTPGIDPTTGAIHVDYVDDDGSRYTLTPNGSSVADMQKRGVDMNKAADGLVTAQGGDPGFQGAFRQAAFDPQVKSTLVKQATDATSQALEDALARNRQSPNPIPEDQIRQRAQTALQTALGNLDRKLDIVKQFGTPPNKMPAAPGNPAPGNPAGASAPAPIPDNTPPEVRARIEAQRNADQQRTSASAATSAAAAAQKQQLQQQSSWLTRESAQSLTADEAKKYLDQYRDVLPGDVARVLALKALPRGPGLYGRGMGAPRS